MKKKYLIFGGILVAIILTVVLTLTSSKEIDKDSLSEIEKYALFRADMTCRFSDYGTSNLWQAMGDMEGLVYEYGYEPEDVEFLEITYGEDNEFWLLMMGYTKELCPDVYDVMVST